MVLKCTGIDTADYFLAPFEVNEGELVCIYVYNGAHYFNTAMYLKDIFCGNIEHKNVIVSKKMNFVNHFVEPAIRRIFSPITVGQYLKRYADLNSPFASEIYKTGWINRSTKMNTLQGTPKKQLAIYATLSKANNIVFDLAGLDPIGAEETCKIVQEAVERDGAAILLDGFDDMKDRCSKFIEIEWKQHMKSNPR